jgi:hypothetical protein
MRRYLSLAIRGLHNCWKDQGNEEKQSLVDFKKTGRKLTLIFSATYCTGMDYSQRTHGVAHKACGWHLPKSLSC